MNPISAVAAGIIAGAIIGIVLAIVFRKPYDKAAEELENLTAEEAQAFADVFSTIANRLKTPGK